MKFNTLGSAATGATTIAIDGVEPTNLIGVTAGNPKWFTSTQIIFQYEVTPAVFGLGRLTPIGGAITNIDSIGQNALAAGNSVWAAYLASGASVGVRTNVSGFGRFPSASLADVDESGLSVIITTQSSGIGLQCYSAAGVQTAANSTALTNSNVKARNGLVCYQDAAGWHLAAIATLAAETLSLRTATVTLMIPVLVSSRTYVVEFVSAVGISIRPAEKANGYIIPNTTSNLFNPDAVFISGTTVRIGGCSASGEAPTELRTFDIDVSTGGFRTGVTTSGTLVWTTQANLTPTPFTVSGSTGGSTAGSILAGLYQQPVTDPKTAPPWKMTETWYQGLLNIFTSLLPINLANQVTGTLPAANGGTGTSTGLTQLQPAWMQFSAASRLLGRGSANGAGTGEEISLGSGLLMSGTVLSSTGAVSYLRVSLNNTQIKALPTTPQTLVAAQGASTRVLLHQVQAFSDFSAGAYTNVDLTNAYLYVALQNEELWSSAIINDSTVPVTHLSTFLGAADQQATFVPYQDPDPVIGLAPFVTGYTAASTNVPLQFIFFNNAAGALTGGHASNTLILDIFYAVVAT